MGRLTLNVTDAVPWADVPNCIKSRMLGEPSVHCPLLPDCPCSMSDCPIPAFHATTDRPLNVSLLPEIASDRVSYHTSEKSNLPLC